MSIRRMMLFTLERFFKSIISLFKTRVLSDSGNFEAETNLENQLNTLGSTLFDSASLVITPNGVKSSKLYSIKPNDGTGDLTVSRNTSATRIDENGNIVDVPANVARIDYSNGSPAILSEPQRTNLVFPSDIATTQVRAVTAQVYTLSFYGSGSVALSGAYGGTLNGTGTNNRVSLTFTPTAGNLTLTVNGSVTNWQLEAGSNATSYIPTTTSSVTRNADVISNTNASTLIGQTEGTILIKGAQFNRGVVFRVRNNTNISVNRMIIFGIDTGGNVEVGVMKNNVNVSTVYYLNVKKKNIIMVYSQNIFKVFINGQLIYQYNYPISTDFTAVLNTVDFGSISENGTANFDFISLWKTQLTDAQAIQLTTL